MTKLPFGELDEEETQLYDFLLAESPSLSGTSFFITRAAKIGARCKEYADFFRERYQEFESASAGDGAHAYLDSDGEVHPMLEAWSADEKHLANFLDECMLSPESRAKFIDAIGGSSEEVVKLAEQKAHRFS